MAKLSSIVYGSVAILILFILASTMILPEFSKSWRYCQELAWQEDNATDFANCPNRYWDCRNTTPVVFGGALTHTDTCSGETITTSHSTNASAYCLNCDTLGGYRTTSQGLLLLVLVMGLLMFAVIFIPKLR